MLEFILYIVYGVLTGMLVIIFRQLYRMRKQFAPNIQKSKMAVEADLPSVSVCIPARNEQHALTECLESVLASTYEKLEIIVLDDASGDKTSTLIKSFASAGVRFVQGSSLPRGWLGKNHALQNLLNEASGSYVFFMDVDTKISPTAIENTVRYALSKRAAMVTVLPRREDGWRASVLFSTLRYFWEVIFHRRLWPATSSNAWLIHRHLLENRFDGFNAFKNTVQPETKIAVELAQTGQYRFLISTPEFGVAYEKKWRSQLITSVRLLYPLMGGSVVISAFAILDLLLLLVPIVIFWLTLLFPGLVSVPLLLLSSALYIGYSIVYIVYTHAVWKNGWQVAFILWPYLIIQEIALIFMSTLLHLRGTVKWKGRPIQPATRS